MALSEFEIIQQTWDVLRLHVTFVAIHRSKLRRYKQVCVRGVLALDFLGGGQGRTIRITSDRDSHHIISLWLHVSVFQLRYQWTTAVDQFPSCCLIVPGER